MEEMLIDYILA